MKKYTPVLDHKGHPKHNIQGPFGPHAGKQICAKCGGAFVRWLSADFFAAADGGDLTSSMPSSSLGKETKGDDTATGILQYSLYSMYSMYYIISRQNKKLGETKWH